jgi:hypothetical protein
MKISGCVTDGVYRVVYKGYYDHVHELHLDPNPGSTWADNDLTDLASGPQVSTGGVFAYADKKDVCRLVYAALDMHVHELRLEPGGTWIDSDLTSIGGGAMVSAGGSPYAYLSPDPDSLTDDICRVVYWATDTHVHELRLEPGATWVDADLTSIGGGVGVGASGDPWGYRTPDGVCRVVYTGVDRHVHELHLDPTSGSTWADADLSSAAGGPLVMVGCSPFAYVTPDAYRVTYAGIDQNVHELRLQSGAWMDANLGGSADGNVWGYLAPKDVYRVVYPSSDGNIHELHLDSGGSWIDNNLSGLGGGDPGTEPFGWVTPDNVCRVEYRSSNGGDLHELRLEPTNGGWLDVDLNEIGGDGPVF